MILMTLTTVPGVVYSRFLFLITEFLMVSRLSWGSARETMSLLENCCLKLSASGSVLSITEYNGPFGPVKRLFGGGFFKSFLYSL